MNEISFTTANFVAREVGYHMTDGWGQGDQAATAWFSPIETYRERFDAMLGEVAALGFNALDLWVAHLSFAWATPEHIEIVRSTVADRNMHIVCYGAAGNTVDENRAVCRICTALGIPMMRGASKLLQDDRQALVNNLRDAGLFFALENHPEKSSVEVMDKIGWTDADVIGVTIDAGWFVTNKVYVPDAILALAPRLKNFHMKDVKALRAEKTGFPFIDMGHETCKLGDGIADIERCFKTLMEIGYKGPIGIEHEPEEFNPSADLAASRVMLERWLKNA